MKMAPLGEAGPGETRGQKTSGVPYTIFLPRAQPLSHSDIPPNWRSIGSLAADVIEGLAHG